MRPVVTPAEMVAIDAAAPEPVDELIARAAWAVAVQAIEMLDYAPYGKRIAILAGPGNNGQDGRLAAPHLQRRGAQCTTFAIGSGASSAESDHGSPDGRYEYDLLIDACFGTGLRRDFNGANVPVPIGSAPVLAVDIPSGVDGLTGALRGTPIRADRTVTFAAAKPGLLLPPGRSYVGELAVADIGLDCSRATIANAEPVDVVRGWPRRGAAAHKWQRAVMIIGGSPGMTGAVALASEAALRSGAGYATQVIPPTGGAGSFTTTGHPVEAVQLPVSENWTAEVLGSGDSAGPIDRHGAVVIGPGLPVDNADQVREAAAFLAATTTPTVVDAGALTAIASLAADGWQASGPMVITPHDGEFARLTGNAPGPDRIDAVRNLAARLNLVVLLKGATTVIAEPGGRVLLSTAGDQRLATAGTGDVLSGVIAAGIAGGLEPFNAAGLGSELHGLAAARCRPRGMTAGDLPNALAELLSETMGNLPNPAKT